MKSPELSAPLISLTASEFLSGARSKTNAAVAEQRLSHPFRSYSRRSRCTSQISGLPMCRPDRTNAWADARGLGRADSQCDARVANRRNSARSPLYLATLRFRSNPCFRTFPLLSHTCHSHFVWLCLMIISSYMAAAAGPLGQCSPVSAQAHCIDRFGLQFLPS
jgi:hypothetical protein